MNDVAAGLLSFMVGGVVGTGILFTQGDFVSAPSGPAVAPLAVAVAARKSPSPVALAAATSVPAANPARSAPVIPAPTPTPNPPVANPPAMVAKAPPQREAEPFAPHGRLILAGMGSGAMSVSADKVRRGRRVVVPLMKADGAVTAHSPDGTFTLDIRYASEGNGLKISIDCTPMALLTADDQTATHLSGIRVGRGPTRVDVKGGSAGQFSFFLSRAK